MNLDTYSIPDDLYLARGADVNPNRPAFTGDVYRDVEIPGVQAGGLALVVAHPCSFRIGAGQLADRLLLAAVEASTKQGANAWRTRFFNRMPLTDVDGAGYWVGDLDRIGRSLTADLFATDRLACLSEFGVNMLQQRLTFHLTRAEIPTATFAAAFAHTFEEADLLEEWTDILTDGGWSQAKTAAEFEKFIRSGEPSLQERLLDPQNRSSVRRACRQQAALLVDSQPAG